MLFLLHFLFNSNRTWNVFFKAKQPLCSTLTVRPPVCENVCMSVRQSYIACWASWTSRSSCFSCIILFANQLNSKLRTTFLQCKSGAKKKFTQQPTLECHESDCGEKNGLTECQPANQPSNLSTLFPFHKISEKVYVFLDLKIFRFYYHNYD